MKKKSRKNRKKNKRSLGENLLEVPKVGSEGENLLEVPHLSQRWEKRKKKTNFF